jgi:HK97 family phage major capsid protein
VHKAAATGHNTIVPDAGGFLVQSDFAMSLRDRAYADSILATRATKITLGIGKNGYSYPEPQDYDQSGGSISAGLLAYWMDEAGQYTKKQVSLKIVNTKLKKLGCLAYFTDEQMEDAPALGQWVENGFRKQIVYQLEKAMLFGNGTTQLHGMLSADNNALLVVPKKTGQTAATYIFENANKQNSRFNPMSDESGNGLWICGLDVAEMLPMMSLAVGTGGVPVFMPANGVVGKGFGSMFNKPVVKSGLMKTIGTQNDIALIDPSEFLLIDKGSPTMATSIHVRFEYGEQLLRMEYRVGGRPLWSSKLKLESGIEVSPYVSLQVRS